MRLTSILFVLVFLSSPLSNAETLKIAFAQWPPWKVFTAKSFDGIDARVISELAERSGIDVEFVKCPWVRCLSFIKEGRADLITSFGKTPERQQYAEYLGSPYFVDKITFWINNRSPLKIRSYEDLSGLTIGIAKGSVYFSRFDQDPSLKKIRLDLEGQMFLMLDAERIDTFIGYETTMNYQLAGGKFHNHFTPAEYKVSGQDYYLAMSKRSKHLRLKPMLTKELAAMREEGVINRIIEEYIQETSLDVK